MTTGNGNNVVFYSNESYDALTAQAKDSADKTQRMSLMHQAEEILMQDMPLAPVYFTTDQYLLKSYIKGFFTSPQGIKYFMYVKS